MIKANNIFIKKTQILITMVLFILLFTLFLLSNFVLEATQFNICSIIIFLISFSILGGSINSIYKNGIKSYNLFFLIFNFFLLLNTFNLLDIQVEKNWVDLYYFFVGQILYGGCLFYGESSFFALGDQKKNKKINLISTRHLMIVLLVLYIIVNIIYFRRVGIRLLAKEVFSMDTGWSEEKYSIGGLNGILFMLSWLLMLFSQYLDRKKSVIVFVLVCFCQGVLMFKRGDVIRFILFFSISALINKKNNVISKKNLKKIFLYGMLALFIFVFMGEFRQYRRDMVLAGRHVFNINTMLKGKIDNKYLNWLQGYTSINFDALKQYVISTATFRGIRGVFLPITRFVLGGDSVQSYYNEIAVVTTNRTGFATTFLCHSIFDMSSFYIVEIILLGMITAFFISLCKKYNMSNVYKFLLYLISLNIFGDYFSTPLIYAVIIFSVILNFVLIDVNLQCDYKNKEVNYVRKNVS